MADYLNNLTMCVCLCAPTIDVDSAERAAIDLTWVGGDVVCMDLKFSALYHSLMQLLNIDFHAMLMASLLTS